MISVMMLVAALQGPGSVQGHVVDATSKRPIADAVVAAGRATTRTNSHGHFAVRGLPAGPVTLRVRRLGFVPAEVVVAITPGVPADVEIALTPLPVVLEAVTVEVAPGAAVLSGDDLRRRGASLAEAIDGWQGVAVVRRASGSAATPVVRGSAPDEVLVLVDGMPINDPFTGVADLSRIGTSDVERVMLVPGAQSARFGARALASVLVIETAAHPETAIAGWMGSHGAGGLEAVAGIDDDGWRLGASLGVEGAADGYPVTLPASRGGGESTRENAGATRISANVRVDGPVGGALRGHWASRGLPGTLSNPSRTGRAVERWVAATAWTGAARLAAEFLSSDLEDPDPPLGLPFASSIRAAGAEGTLRSAAAGIDLEVGGRVDVVGGSAVGRTATAVRGHVSASRPIVGAAGQWQLALVPIVRVDAWNRAGSPSVSVRADVTADRGALVVRVGGGRSASHPVLADHLFHEGVGVQPNPDLRPARVPWELDASIDWRWTARQVRGTLGARGFLGRVVDLVLWAPDFRFVWSPGNWDVRRSGIELTGHVELADDRLTADASYGLARVRYDRPGGPQVIYRPTHVGSVRLTGRPWWGWDVWGQARRLGTRYPNHGGVNPLSPVTTVDAGVAREVRLGSVWLRAAVEARDLTDRRLEFIAGQPLAGRTLTFRIGFEHP